MTKPLIIYHAQCMDGFTAAWAAWKTLGDGAEYLAAAHGEAPPDVTDRDVVIVDFAYPRAALLDMERKANSLRVLDHHKTAEEDLAGLEFATFDLSKSGAMLAWEHWHPLEDAPAFVRYVQDKDLWLWELEESEEFSAALQSIPYDFAAYDALTVEQLRTEGRAILRFQTQLVREICGHATRATIAGYDVPCVNGPVLQSYVGNVLCQGEPFAAVWFERPDGTRRYSLRSAPPNGIDVSAVAKKFGGGGHAAASGFNLDRTVSLADPEGERDLAL